MITIWSAPTVEQKCPRTSKWKRRVFTSAVSVVLLYYSFAYTAS